MRSDTGLRLLKILLIIIVLFGLFVLALVTRPSIDANTDSYIIIKLPDGNVVKGYGKYKDIYSNQGYVCIDGTWYRTSYQNVVIMTKK